MRVAQNELCQDHLLLYTRLEALARVWLQWCTIQAMLGFHGGTHGLHLPYLVSEAPRSFGLSAEQEPRQCQPSYCRYIEPRRLYPNSSSFFISRSPPMSGTLRILADNCTRRSSSKSPPRSNPRLLRSIVVRALLAAPGPYADVTWHLRHSIISEYLSMYQPIVALPAVTRMILRYIPSSSRVCLGFTILRTMSLLLSKLAVQGLDGDYSSVWVWTGWSLSIIVLATRVTLHRVPSAHS